MRAVIYTASAPKVDIVDQHRILSEYAQQRNIKVVRSYSDTDAWNKPAKSLTGINGVLRSAEDRSVEIVLVHCMSLLGSSLSHMLKIVQTLSKQKVGVMFYKQDLTTHGDAGVAPLKVLMHLAECESAKFSLKVQTGMLQAESSGVRLGRPSVINPSLEACVITLRAKGVSVAQIAKIVCIGVGTTYRILRDAEVLEVG